MISAFVLVRPFMISNSEKELGLKDIMVEDGTNTIKETDLVQFSLQNEILDAPDGEEAGISLLGN